MKKVKTNKLTTYLFFFFFSSNLFSQVTIGSDEPPVEGSLLQLKNIKGVNDGSKNADKGLGLPRVKINALDKLQLGDAEELADKEAYTGLLVYNTNVIETAENRVCQGLHVWDGEAWLPLIAYAKVVEPDPENLEEATVIDVKKEILSKELHNDPINYPIGPLGKHTDIRGPSNEETNDYYIARFYASKVKEKITTTYQGKSAYACKPSDPTSGATWTEETEVERIEDGIWMCENMRTKFAPNAESTPISFDYWDTDGYATAYWSYPGAEPLEEVQVGTDEEGLLYNWTAATVGADGKHGRGGETGIGLAGDLDCRDERFLHLYPVQGICPDGWHLPSMKDYDMLREAALANPSLYSTDANLPTEYEIGKAFKHPSTEYYGDENKGTSKEAWEGGFAAYLTGGVTGQSQEYGLAAHFWTSSNIKEDGCFSALRYALYFDHSYFGLDLSYRHYVTAVRCMKY